MPHDDMIDSKDIEFVKDQASFHKRMTERFSSDSVRGPRHEEMATKFLNLADKLHEASLKLKEPQPTQTVSGASVQPPAYLRIGNLDDLPPEVRNQLKISESDQLEMDILAAINDFGGTAAIDEVLVALWRKTGEVQDREFLARKIYRMSRAGMVRSARRKGYFTTSTNAEDIDQGEEETVDDLLGE